MALKRLNEACGWCLLLKPVHEEMVVVVRQRSDLTQQMCKYHVGEHVVELGVLKQIYPKLNYQLSQAQIMTIVVIQDYT